MSDNTQRPKRALGESATDEPEKLYVPGFYAGTNDVIPPLPAGVDSIGDGASSDLSRRSIETLSDYLGRLTTGDIAHQPDRRFNKSNTFAVSTEFNSAPIGSKEPSRSSVEGAKTDIEESGFTLGTFIDTVRESDAANRDQAANRFEKTSTSHYGSNSQSFNPFVEGNPPLIDKTAGRDGHTLLPSIREEKKTEASVGAPAIFSETDMLRSTEAQRRISYVLRNNRFNPYDSTPFMRDHEIVSDEKGTRSGATKQGVLGKYIKDAEFILSEDLKSVGSELITAATGQDDLREALNPDGSIDWSNLLSLTKLTGWDSVESRKMRAALTPAGQKLLAQDAGVKTSLLTSEDDGKRRSYGTLNSSLEPFSGAFPVSMVVNTLIGGASLITFSLAIAGLVQPFANRDDEGSVPSGIHPRLLTFGRHTMISDFNSQKLMQLFRIPQIEHDFDLCLVAGILSFYGITELPDFVAKSKPDFPSISDVKDKIKEGASLNILDKFISISTTAGYYSVITRAAARDVKQITKAWGKIGDLNFADATVQFFSLIESIVESTTYKFLMTMVALGDKMISSIEGHPTLSIELNPRPLDGPVSTIRYNRNAAGNITWRNSSVNSAFVLPQRISKAVERARNSDAQGPADATGKSGGLFGNNKLSNIEKLGEFPADRMDDQAVAVMEDSLNAEYMPFYFHDIRTNEYIAFHAFLTSLDDSYAADYTSTSAYGRGDDIKIYSKTTRTVGVKFIVAATNKDDLSEMYWKINKLVSLVYPQWSRGRSVISGEGEFADKFIQPFSQIPTASPLVRLRVGDVLTSNYSRFNLMRLFGIGEDSSVFNLADPITTKVVDEEKKKDADKEYEEERSAEIEFQALKFVDPGGDDATQRQQIATMIDLVKRRLSSFRNLDERTVTDIANRLSSVSVDDNTKFGFTIGDIIKIDPTHGAGNKGYFPRDSEGRLRMRKRKKTTLKEYDAIAHAEQGGLGRLGGSRATSATFTGGSFDGLDVPPEDVAEVELRGRVTREETISVPPGPADRLVNYTNASIGFDFKVIARIPDAYSSKIQNEVNFQQHVAGAPRSGDSFGGVETERALESQYGNSSDERAKNFYGTMAYLIQAIPGSAADNHLAKLGVPASLRYHRVLHSQIRRIASTVKKTATEDLLIDKIVTEGADRFRNFFDPKNNYIIRSFESTMGRGLAGFVTQLGIEWKLNDSTWDIDPGQRAPKLVEINISFAPIHDIPMGLDSAGMMRSLPYNVGEKSNSLAGDPIGTFPEIDTKNIAATQVDTDFATEAKDAREAAKQLKGANSVTQGILSKAKGFV